MAGLPTTIVFIADMSLKGKAGSTISLQLAALAHLHRVYNWGDPTKHFLIQKMVEGCKRDRRSHDTRRPITEDILHQVLQALSFVCRSPYERALFQSAFSLAFFGFLRVSECTAPSRKGANSRALAISDVTLVPGPPVAL